MYHSFLDRKSRFGAITFTSQAVRWMGFFCILHGALGILLFLLFPPAESMDKLFSFLVSPGIMYDAPLIIVGGLGIIRLHSWARKLVIYLIDLKLTVIVIALLFIFMSSFERGLLYFLAMIYAANGLIIPLIIGYILLQDSVKDVFKKKN